LFAQRIVSIDDILSQNFVCFASDQLGDTLSPLTVFRDQQGFTGHIADIKTGRVLDVLQAKLENTGIANRQIWLEATERGFMDMQAARATIDKARAQGFWVAIDDFGTGYSSLSYLQKLPLDALKIDKSFIDTIGTDSVSSNVTPHIIDMAKTLQLNIVAEGIETQEQADYLLAREVEYGQGWLYSKALPAADFMQFCQTRAGAAATTTSG
jgi:sensor c-di-GMP phosphodiesterase-like protein